VWRGKGRYIGREGVDILGATLVDLKYRSAAALIPSHYFSLILG
jgi:hypothetical protein